MKTLSLKLFFLSLFISTSHLIAQDVTTIEASNSDISDNLDLEAVASIFGESKDLEDFEKKLNDPSLQISNLDLNNDGEVDYLRVMETAQGDAHTISIESILAKDQYQQVATIDVVKDKSNNTQVQVVGNVEMYGPNYCITPHYPVVPVFFTFFWMATYRPWYSPWHWGYHPPYFRPWRPYPPYRYHSNVNIHVNVNNRYTHNNVRINNNNINVNNRNNSYFKNNPDKTFNKRNPGVTNRTDLNNNRKTVAKDKGINNKSDLQRATKDKGYKSTGKPVTKPSTIPSAKPSTKPAARPSSKPTSKPSTKPATKPSTRPATKPSTRPSTKPSTRPSSRPSSKPASRPSHSRASTPRRSYRR